MLFPTPYNYTKNSVFIRLEASFSPSVPLADNNESISSINTMAPFSSFLANSNKALINLSDSPYHLLTKSDDDTEKNVELVSAAKH